MAGYAVPDPISRGIQAYIDSLGPKPGVPEALQQATPWQQQQAMDLAEAQARESAGGPGYYLPGGVVLESTADTNMPGHALYGPQQAAVFHTYHELVQQLASEQNRGRKAVILGAHGGPFGLSTAFYGPPVTDAQGKMTEGPRPTTWNAFSLQRFLSDLPPNYQQAVLASCNPRYVLGQSEHDFRQGAHRELMGWGPRFGNAPVSFYDVNHDEGYDHGLWGVPIGGHTMHPQTWARHQGREGDLATAVAPSWIGLAEVSTPSPEHRSYPDVPILAGDGTNQGTDQLSEHSVFPAQYQFDRAADVMAWARSQVPRYIAEDQLANYNATLGAPEMQLPEDYLPARAQGGPVQAGQPTLVGEQGPEMYVPAPAATAHPVYTYLTALAHLRGA